MGSPGLLVPKNPIGTSPAGTNKTDYRLVVDYRELNKFIVADAFEPPSCDLCVAWLSDKVVRTKMDMRWGFHQLAISERMMDYFSFVTPLGTYAYKRLVMASRTPPRSSSAP